MKCHCGDDSVRSLGGNKLHTAGILSSSKQQLTVLLGRNGGKKLHIS